MPTAIVEEHLRNGLVVLASRVQVDFCREGESRRTYKLDERFLRASV